jgi:hypothetical protein
MKKWLIGFMMAATAVAAQAEAPRVRLFGSLAYGWGGDKLVSGTYVGGSDFELLAGTGWVMAIGGDLRITDSIALQASLGQQRNRVVASNGEFDFFRNPVEVLGFYSVSEQLRLGLGVRKNYNAKVTGTGVASTYAGTGNYDSTTGAVLEGQYLFSAPKNERSFVSGLSLRFVRENFKLAEDSGGTGEEKRGDHMALSVFFYY